jgi:hypothetical protein
MHRQTRLLRHGPLRYACGSSSLVLGKDLHPLVPVNAKFFDPAKLRKQLDDDGFLYFKNIIPQEVVSKALADVAQQLAANGWISNADLEEFLGSTQANGGYSMGVPFPKHVLQAAAASKSEEHPPTGLPPPKVGFSLSKEIQEAIAGVNVMSTVRQVFGGMVVPMPHHSLELAAPGEPHGFHMDSIYINRGSKLVLTAWVPLHHTPLSLGGLILARGSNSASCYEKIRKTYGSMDVETAGIRGDGSYTSDGLELAGLGKRKIFDPVVNQDTIVDDTPLSTASFQAGDVVLMTVYTMHAFMTNNSNFWRISGESKWLMDGDDAGIDPRHSARGDALARWQQTREDPKLFPRTMEEAKKEWGLTA